MWRKSKSIVKGGYNQNKKKINTVIGNAQVFIKIQDEYGSFHDYIETFTKGETFHER